MCVFVCVCVCVCGGGGGLGDCVHMGPAVLPDSIEVLSDGQQETQTIQRQ